MMQKVRGGREECIGEGRREGEYGGPRGGREECIGEGRREGEYGGLLGPFRSHFGVRRLELAVSGICSSHTGVLLQPFSSSSLGVSRFRYML